jgi:hypothetical protein
MRASFEAAEEGVEALQGCEGENHSSEQHCLAAEGECSHEVAFPMPHHTNEPDSRRNMVFGDRCVIYLRHLLASIEFQALANLRFERQKPPPLQSKIRNPKPKINLSAIASLGLQ